jgi:lipopolysaccharide heptosyltransferase I
MSVPRRILIVRLSSLGDILHALPAFQSLRAAFPEAEIDWLIEQRMKFLLAALPGLNELMVLDTKSLRSRPWSLEAWRQFGRLIRRLRARRYDVALDFQGLLKTALLTCLSGARVRMGFSRELVRERPAHWFYHQKLRPPSQETHVARLNQGLARAAGGIASSGPFPLSVGDDDRDTILARLRVDELSEYVVINPGGGWSTKRWGTAKYGALASRIHEELKLGVVVTTGPGEEKLFEEMCRHCTGAPLRQFSVPFRQLIPLYQRAQLVIGGDTGPFHLASMLGTPVVGIFGPTSPVRNGPLSENDEVVVHQLHCSFCYGRSCPTQNECMDISVEEVFSAVTRRLAGARDPR